MAHSISLCLLRIRVMKHLMIRYKDEPFWEIA